MSMVVENTAVVNAEYAVVALEDANLFSYKDSAKIVFQNKDIAVIVFDSNGGSCFEMIPEQCSTPQEMILALESNYLDGEGPYMVMPQELEGKTRISRWLKGKVSDEDLRKIRKSISYSKC